MISRNFDTLACSTATTLMCGHISQEAVHPRRTGEQGLCTHTPPTDHPNTNQTLQPG